MADPVTLGGFRAQLAAFADSTTFPDADVEFYLRIANGTVNADRWGDLYASGVCLLVAHYITLAAVNNHTNEMGGIGGLRAGPIASESGDKVSVSFATNAVTDPKAGDFNATTWGRQYWNLAMLMGAGPLQVGVPSPTDPVYVGISSYPYFPFA